MKRALFLLTFQLFACCGAWAQKPSDENTRAEQFREFAKKEATTYTIQLEGSSRPLEFHPEPILKWSNPVIGSIYGDVFIWTENGRPEAVASIYKFYSPLTHRANEFHSLSFGKLTGRRDGVAVWTPSKPGLELKPVAGAPVPDGSATVRLRQMKLIAQEFTARQITGEGVDREMRLLNQPIYRYENTKGDLVDGGLFVFVVGTDPEAFLLIEARRTSGGPLEWQFGATRMTHKDLKIKQRDRVVWNVARLPWPQVWDGREPYVVFRFDLAPGEL
jgi:hypothetical protein